MYYVTPRRDVFCKDSPKIGYVEMNPVFFALATARDIDEEKVW